MFRLSGCVVCSVLFGCGAEDAGIEEAPFAGRLQIVAPSWTGEGGQAGAAYGASVGAAGDVNGDGLADAIVGAPFFDGAATDEGRAFVYHGGVAGLEATAAWTTSPTGDASTNFGNSVASAGDVNGDGFDDVIVGAPYVAAGQQDEGRAYVFHGSAIGLSGTAAWTADANNEGARMGTSVASAGDVNGDGFGDVIVGAPYFTAGQSDEGRAFLFLGSVDGVSATPAWAAEPNQNLALFGASVDSAGDVNGDGFDDVIVGIPFWSNGADLEGAARVYLGSVEGLDSAHAWSTESNQSSGQLGLSVSAAGDVNGDGFDDVIVGASSYDGGLTNEGSAWVHLGSAGGPSASPDWSAEGDQYLAFFGLAVSAAGDVNGDGYDDAAVGAFGYDGDLGDEGLLSVFLGSAGGLSQTAELTAEGDQAPVTYFASSIGALGDVDGDGYDDLLVGASAYDLGQNDEGAAFVYRGSCADALDTDGDTIGDACDVCPGADDLVDSDADGIADGCDVCADAYDPLQADDDADGLGDACDDCSATEPDADADGFCAALDCDDSDPDTFPGAPQVCDGVDNTCGGVVPAEELDEDQDGFLVCAGDCDDTDASRHPDMVESCNGVDDDCDGSPSVDELDADADGATTCGGDCDDADDRMAPALFDLCGDGLDNDCDGTIDQTCAGNEPLSARDEGGCGCTGSAGAAGPLLAAAGGLALALRRRRVMSTISRTRACGA